MGIADQQLTRAFSDGSWGPIATALDQFETFAKTVNRVLFLGLNGYRTSSLSTSCTTTGFVWSMRMAPIRSTS